MVLFATHIDCSPTLQVPVSGPNGQTVYQQMPVPVQVQPAQTALVPVAVQTSSGQQG